MNRREAREQAFIFIFESTFGAESIEDIIEAAKIARNIEIDEFCERIFKGVKESEKIIDEYIEKNIKQWKMDRLSRVILSVLRLAIYEMLYENDIPLSVSVNEAVELAKKYDTKENTAYVNGVLASVLKEISEKNLKDDSNNEGKDA